MGVYSDILSKIVGKRTEFYSLRSCCDQQNLLRCDLVKYCEPGLSEVPLYKPPLIVSNPSEVLCMGHNTSEGTYQVHSTAHTAREGGREQGVFTNQGNVSVYLQVKLTATIDSTGVCSAL